MVIYLGSLVQLLYREGHCIQISLACVGIACSIWVTLGLPPFMACVLFWSTLMCQVALTETVWGGPWVVFTSQVYTAQIQVLRYSRKTQTPLGLCFVPFPDPSSSCDQVLGEHRLPRCGASYHLHSPSGSVSWVHDCVSDMPCVSSSELIYTYDPLDGCQLSRIPGKLG